MKYPVDVNDTLKDGDGNVYLIVDERLSLNQNTHSQRTNIDYLCRDLGRKKERWVQYSTMLGMFKEGKLERHAA